VIDIRHMIMRDVIWVSLWLNVGISTIECSGSHYDARTLWGILVWFTGVIRDIITSECSGIIMTEFWDIITIECSGYHYDARMFFRRLVWFTNVIRDSMTGIVFGRDYNWMFEIYIYDARSTNIVRDMLWLYLFRILIWCRNIIREISMIHVRCTNIVRDIVMIVIRESIARLLFGYCDDWMLGYHYDGLFRVYLWCMNVMRDISMIHECH